MTSITAKIKKKDLKSRGYTEQGVIESVSIQGTQVFAVVRLAGFVLPDMMGNPVRCARHLVGIPKYAPEHTASMAEVLIPININSSIQVTNIATFIDAKVQVFFRGDGFPECAMLCSDSDSRAISREEMFNWRRENKDYIIDGFTKKKIDITDYEKSVMLGDIEREKYEQEFHKGAVGIYGNKQNMHVATESHRGDFVDFEVKQNPKMVIGDVSKTTRTKNCYYPATVLTGR